MSETDAKVISRSGTTGYMPQLDGLRAFAVTAVLIHHFKEGGWGTGAIAGVRMFFVLSGFLITSIVLRDRQAAVDSSKSRGVLLKNFYARRFLRIFPLYYFVIGVAVLVNAECAREYIGWLVTYTLNIKMANQGWFIANFAHFWSLAVEEQFYIFWPWFVLFLPKKYLLPAACVMIAVGPLYRLYHVIGWAYFASEATNLPSEISTFACLDSLGMGSLLAILSQRSASRELLRCRLASIALPMGAIMYVVVNYFSRWDVALVLSDLALATFFSWLIYAASIGFRRPVGRLLESRPIRYVGKISYGIYVYHPLMPGFVLFLFGKLGLKTPESHLIQFAIWSIATVLISSISWFLLESPINNLKRYFTTNKAPVMDAESSTLVTSPADPVGIQTTPSP